MIKLFVSILIVLVILSLIGGIIEIESTDERWGLIVNKEAAVSSIQNGAIRVYEFADELISDNSINSIDLK